MSTLFRRRLAWSAAVGVLALAGAGCANNANTGGATPTSPGEVSPPLSGPADPTDPVDPSNPANPTKAPTKTTAAAPSWPTPEDCVSYNPNNITVQYEAGIYTVNDGSKQVMRLHGGPGEVVGEQGLALAKRYSKHCYLGRGNNREEKDSYVFDYWRGSSGMTPTIPDEEDACSDYNRSNLTVENMGDGYGWRVKDHDHVLHVFDNESDARNGKLVASKYHQICFIGNSGPNDEQEFVSYFR